MLALQDQVREPYIATEAEAEIARQATLRLKPLAEAQHDISIRINDAPNLIVPLPARVLALVVAMLEAMAQRRPVSFIPGDATLTTQQAADFLNVSRPYLVGLLDKGEIPHRMVGTHRRVTVADLQAYKTRSNADRKAALTEMADEARRLGLK